MSNRKQVMMVVAEAEQSEGRDKDTRTILAKYPALAAVPMPISIGGVPAHRSFVLWLEEENDDGYRTTQLEIEVRDGFIAEPLARDLRACGYRAEVITAKSTTSGKA